MIEPTGFCWKCGKLLQPMNHIFPGQITIISKELFCSPKHKEQYEREQEKKIKKGKRAGYGLSGSCH